MSMARDHFHERAKIALEMLHRQPTLVAAVQAEVDAFFARNPGLERTELSAGFIASLALERFEADSQSAHATQTEVA